MRLRALWIFGAIAKQRGSGPAQSSKNRRRFSRSDFLSRPFCASRSNQRRHELQQASGCDSGSCWRSQNRDGRAPSETASRLVARRERSCHCFGSPLGRVECAAGFAQCDADTTALFDNGVFQIARLCYRRHLSSRRPEAVFAPAPGEDGGTVHVEAELGAEKMVEKGDFCGISGFAHFN